MLGCSMKKFYIIFILFLPLLVWNCQARESKTEKAVNDENKKLGKFLQQPETELKIIMGEPDEITYDNKGSKFFIYNKKKYSITCTRKFEIDKNKMIVGYTSKGCF